MITQAMVPMMMPVEPFDSTSTANAPINNGDSDGGGGEGDGGGGEGGGREGDDKDGEADGGGGNVGGGRWDGESTKSRAVFSLLFDAIATGLVSVE